MRSIKYFWIPGGEFLHQCNKLDQARLSTSLKSKALPGDLMKTEGEKNHMAVLGTNLKYSVGTVLSSYMEGATVWQILRMKFEMGVSSQTSGQVRNRTWAMVQPVSFSTSSGMPPVAFSGFLCAEGSGIIVGLIPKNI